MDEEGKVRGLKKEKDFVESFAESNERLRSKKPLWKYLYHKAIEMWLKGNQEEQIKYLDQALAVNPDSGELLSYKGHILYELGKFEDAIKYIDKAIKSKDERIGFSWLTKADALMHLDRFKEAVECYDKHCSIMDYPDTVLIKQGYAWGKLNEWEKVDEVIKKVEKNMENYPKESKEQEKQDEYIQTLLLGIKCLKERNLADLPEILWG